MLDDNDLGSQLERACSMGLINVVKTLLASKANPNHTAQLNAGFVFTPLSACFSRLFSETLECAKYLLENRADPNLPTWSKSSLLQWLVLSNNEKAVELLLKHGADPEGGAALIEGRTPLECAIYEGLSQRCILLLLDARACTRNVKDNPLAMQRRCLKHLIVSVMGTIRYRLRRGRDVAQMLGEAIWRMRNH